MFCNSLILPFLQAVEHYQYAANSGNYKAQYNLAVLSLREKEKLNLDPGKAISLLEASAEQGFAKVIEN